MGHKPNPRPPKPHPKPCCHVHGHIVGLDVLLPQTLRVRVKKDAKTFTVAATVSVSLNKLTAVFASLMIGDNVFLVLDGVGVVTDIDARRGSEPDED